MFEAEVALGAAWLDEHQPGWEGRVDLDNLDMGKGCRCVLGQSGVEGDYLSTLLRLHGVRSLTDDLILWACDHGFNLSPHLARSERSSQLQELDEAWVALIKERHDTSNLSGLDQT